MKIKIFRSDNGKEYLDKNFLKYLHKNGIVGQTTSVNTPAEWDCWEKKLTLIRSG